MIFFCVQTYTLQFSQFLFHFKTEKKTVQICRLFLFVLFLTVLELLCWPNLLVIKANFKKLRYGKQLSIKRFFLSKNRYLSTFYVVLFETNLNNLANYTHPEVEVHFGSLHPLSRFGHKKIYLYCIYIDFFIQLYVH